MTTTKDNTIKLKKISLDDLAEDAIEKLSCCLILDTSYSMRGKAIDELNKAVEMYFKEIENNERTKETVETAIITFGNKEFSDDVPEHERDPRKGVKTLLDYWEINTGKVPTLSAADGGFTSMGEAVETGLDLVLKRKIEYKEHVGTYKQPWLVIMTDGKPYDIHSTGGQSIDGIAKKTADLVKNAKLHVMLIVVGEDVDIDLIRKFSPKRWNKGKLIKNNPFKVGKTLKFDKLFQFLSQSLADPKDGFADPKDYPDLEELF